MQTLTQEDFDKLYQHHQDWLNGHRSERPSFIDCDFKKIKFPFHPNLRKAFLEGADLEGVDLRGADLKGAFLYGAFLYKAVLCKADLKDADLRETHLQEADLEGADLRGADLKKANLRDADLTAADFRDADLRGSDLRGTILEEKQESTDKMLQEQIKRLEQERIKLLSSNEDTTKELQEREEQLKKLRNELDELKDKAVGKVDKAFDELKCINKDIKIEINRLNWMFGVYAFLIGTAILGLIVIFCTFFKKYTQGTIHIEWINILIYTPFMVLIVGFIWGFILLLQRAQRQLLILHELTNKINVIESILKAYARVHDEETMSDKMVKTLDEFLQKIVYTRFDLENYEKKKIDDDRNEVFIPGETFQKLLEIVGNIIKKES